MIKKYTLKSYLTKLMSDPPPYISAKSWVIADGHTGRAIFAKGELEKREIASLTKIMTAYTALHLAYKYSIDLENTKVTISEKAGKIGGTRAMLNEGDTLYLWDLFYGLMLPSGNDAAIALAEYFGRIIKENSSDVERFDAKNKKVLLKNPSLQRLFVNEMNKNAKELDLTDTAFANPHGLNNYYNKSTASSVARLASIAMTNEKFRIIVSCKKYTCKGMNCDGEDKVWEWVNTNRLLDKGYNGVKTGVTQCAGPCLVASVKNEKGYLIFVLLNSKSMERRWGEIKKLRKWVMGRFAKIDQMVSEDIGLDKEDLLNKLIHV